MSIQKIVTSKGVYKYNAMVFVNGLKLINKEISKRNLLKFKYILDDNNVVFGLIYGTLLGSLREGDFISHDEDTDVFVLDENREALLDLLFKLRESGFEVGRYDGKILSFVREGEYIDVYFFKSRGSKLRESSGYVIESKHLETLELHTFLEVDFFIPSAPKLLLKSLYGADWMVPKVNTPASNYGPYLRFKFFIKNNMKPIFPILSWLKKHLSSNRYN